MANSYGGRMVLNWENSRKGKHVGVRVTYGNGTSKVFELKAPGFFGMFGDAIKKRLSIDWNHPLTRKKTHGDW